jgi:hypothetical protein
VRDPNGTITTFDVPGTFGVTGANSINDEGAITGSFTDTLGRSHAYIRDPEGNFTTFDPPGSISTSAVSINAGEPSPALTMKRILLSMDLFVEPMEC